MRACEARERLGATGYRLQAEFPMRELACRGSNVESWKIAGPVSSGCRLSPVACSPISTSYRSSPCPTPT